MTAIHGDKQQNERDWVLNEFKTGKSPIMVATDVASRGIGMIDLHPSPLSLSPSLAVSTRCQPVPLCDPGALLFSICSLRSLLCARCLGCSWSFYQVFQERFAVRRYFCLVSRNLTSSAKVIPRPQSRQIQAANPRITGQDRRHAPICRH